MDAIEFINITLPKHDRTSCSDEDVQNGFYTHTIGYNDGSIQWDGRCRRCMALQIINNDSDVPKDYDISECINKN